MPLWAMSLSSISALKGPGGSSRIISGRAGVEVFRVDAGWAHAEVVNRHAGRDLAERKFIADPMCPLFYPTACNLPIKKTIPVGVDRAFPYPARISLLDFGGITDTLIGGLRARSHRYKCTTEYTQFIGEQLLRAARSINEGETK